MTTRMRSTSSQARSKRSHHKIKNPAISVDKDSNSVHLRHRVSPTTGMYKGRKVVNPKVKKSK